MKSSQGVNHAECEEQAREVEETAKAIGGVKCGGQGGVPGLMVGFATRIDGDSQEFTSECVNAWLAFHNRLGMRYERANE